MKKILALSLAALLALSMIGCGKDDEDTVDDGKDVIVAGDVQVEGEFEYSVNEQGYYEIVGYTYKGTAPKSVEVPSSIEGRAVTGIGADAFKAVASLNAITIPDSITYIGDFAFYGCTGLTSVTLPNSVTEIRTGAFYGCTSLTSIELPDGLNTIEKLAFWECSALTGISLPTTLETIGDGAFWACSKLAEVSLPVSVKNVGRAAFMFCDTLAKITVNGAETVIGEDAFDACAEGVEIYAPEASRAHKYALDAALTFVKLG